MAQIRQINAFIELAQGARRLSKRAFTVDYDEEVDVLYINFAGRKQATDSRLRGNKLIRYSGSEVIGITVMHASQELAKSKKTSHKAVAQKAGTGSRGTRSGSGVRIKPKPVAVSGTRS